ncbi:leucine-rich repeat-containing protein 27 [Plakobranchus ocellatus]|uniref:Leucine-rich repeat-containing protein 27 n=1 Tax=Plakobranchus ocellatus TaxID=259542 RepID=A0AAV3Z8D8_9GAST|nr:leucine-rich repeat-containing protein 27 [Plakobranchus ocellatus]
MPLNVPNIAYLFLMKYVKASISDREGTVFGYAVDVPGKLATTLLCIMVKRFFGGPTFVAKILPCHARTAEYQFKKTCELINTLEGCGAKTASNPGWQETAVFIDHVLRLWKVFKTKTVIENIRMRDPDSCAVDLSPTGQKPLENLESWADCHKARE